jgi:hypothetical protein
MTTALATAFLSATLIISCGNPFRPSPVHQEERPGSTHVTGVVIVIGTISSRAGNCPSANLEITPSETAGRSPVRVVTGPSTIVSGQHGCSSLAVGTRVEVEGDQAQDPMRATRIILLSE